MNAKGKIARPCGLQKQTKDTKGWLAIIPWPGQCQTPPLLESCTQSQGHARHAKDRTKDISAEKKLVPSVFHVVNFMTPGKAVIQELKCIEALPPASLSFAKMITSQDNPIAGAHSQHLHVIHNVFQ